MQILYERCAGLDVHKRSVVACALFPENGQPRKERQTFSTMTPDLVRLRDWLKDHDCSCVAMESTGVFWKPIYNLLEEHFQVLVVNAQHIKTVPGRKTDVKDAEWIADLLQHGLLRPSFIPPVWQRSLRDLTRSRATLTQERTRVIARLQKGLEDANIKLASVVSDVMGTSAQHMLHAFPGIKRRIAEILLAEIGPDMSRFPSAAHLASWAGMCPGNRESAGKRLSGKTRKGSQWLRTALVEAAHAASHCKECYLSDQYHHIAFRRGKKRAAVALGHTLLIIIYHVITDEKGYVELGGDYLDQLDRQGKEKRLIHQLEKLGLQVSVTPIAPVA